MNNALIQVPPPVNEPVLGYAPGSPERAAQQQALAEMKSTTIEIMPVVNGERIATGNIKPIHPPHETAHTLGTVHLASEEVAQRAIDAAMAARKDWMQMPWNHRAAIFLKAADLLAGPWRTRLNGATMLGQSKNAHQAEIDSACELIDFLRFNVHFMTQIYAQQPASSRGIWNRTEHRPLDGFVLAITPFNFTAIGGNLPTAPAMLGNTVLWKPATSAVYSAYLFLELLEEAGLPPGVINLLPGRGPDIGNPSFASPHFAGLHFTGSTSTFQFMWRTIGNNISTYRAYPRIVGETGGKDFILAHASADPIALATAIVRGGFEYQGQKCSAASRIYVPDNLWPTVRAELESQLSQVKMGTVEDFTNFVNAVIDRPAFDKITAYIKNAHTDDNVDVLFGGSFSDEEGYYIEPTVLQVQDPKYITMCEEIFGPVVTLYVYPEGEFEETLKLVDETSPYALTGSIFAQDRAAVIRASDALVGAAGNFYINDKPTGAVVGQQPFGGGRASGTNDKAGSLLNLLRWVSPRSIKETFDPPHHFSYPYLLPDE